MGAQWAKKQAGPEAELERLLTCARRAEALAASPDKLQKECDFHFERAGLDAHGDMRRIELRRMLWTFAHGLGSTDLTWEAIEAAAVVGTVEPGVPVVTRDEFFRCVLKTLHLVGAEMRQKAAQMEAHAGPAQPVQNSQQSQQPRPPQRPPPVHATAARSASGSGSSCSRSSSASGTSEASGSGGEGRGSREHVGEERDEQSPTAQEARRTGSSKGMGKSTAPSRKGPFPVPAPAANGHSAEHGPVPGAAAEAFPTEPIFTPAKGDVPILSSEWEQGPLFAPAPGGSPDEAALVNGMMAMILSNEGTFDPQRIFVGHGMLRLSDPADDGKPSFAERLGLASAKGTAFDLSLLAATIYGEAILGTPVAPMLPDFVRRGGREAVDRMLVLAFEEGDLVCLWFNAAEDCELCRSAVNAEAGLG